MKTLSSARRLLLPCILTLALAGVPALSWAEEAGGEEPTAAEATAVDESAGATDGTDATASEETPSDDSSEDALYAPTTEAEGQDESAPTETELTTQDSVQGDAIVVGHQGTYVDTSSGFTYTYEVLSVEKKQDGSYTGTAKLVGMQPTSGAFDGIDNPNGTVDATLPAHVGGFTVVELGQSDDGEVFEGHPYLRTLTIPKTITKLNGSEKDGQLQRGGLWRYGYNLEEITFEEGSTIAEIPAGFFSRTKISTVKLPDTVKSIGNYAFMNCANLTEIALPASLETIGDYAFCSTSLTHVDFPSKLRTIGDYAFSKKVIYTQDIGWEPESYTLTVELDSVILPNTVTSIGAYAFATDGGAYTTGDSYEGLSDIGEITLGTGLKTIGEGAFSGCSVEELVLPNALTTLGKDAFAVSPWLERVRFADADRAQLNTLTGFAACAALTSVEVPPSVTAIGEQAFEDCKALPSIVLPPSVEAIGKSAFNGCEALASIALPPRVATVEEAAFAYCSSLVDPGLSEGVETIGEAAYLGCSALGAVTIPATVSRIGQQAFAGSGVTHLTIATGNTPLTIGARAFRGCAGLSGSTVELPKRVTALGAEAFLYSDNVTYKIYNDALVIGTDDETYGSFYSIDAELTQADLGSLFSSELTATGEKDKNGNPYYMWSMADPWGGSTRDMRQDILNEVSNPAASKVLYPNTLTNKTSPTFDVYVKSVAYQLAHSESVGQYVWPTFEAFDAGGSVEPGPEDPDPATIEEAAKGKLQVYTTGDAGISANICVFDAGGALVASTQSSQGYALLDSLEPATYTVIAFAKNSSFSSVGSLSDFGAMGFTTKDYAKKDKVTVSKDKATEVTLAVPAVSTQAVTKLLESSSVVISKKRVPMGVENFATVNYQMQSGKTATTLVVMVPKGLTVTSVASGGKNYGTSGFNKTTRKLTIALAGKDATTGKIWVGLKGEAAGTYSVNASVVSGGTTAPVGSITFRCYGLELDVPSEPVSGTSFEATVRAKPGSTVTVTAADKSFTFGPTNKAGSFTGTVELGDYSALGVNRLSVNATVQDGGTTYDAAGSVTIETTATLNAPKLEELSFVHGGVRTSLVRAGKRDMRHYTYYAFGDDRPSYKTWTFSATYLHSEEMTGTATVQVQMLDGSSRYQQMALKNQSQQKDGTWKADFTTAMYIEQAGNHVFNDASLIPVAFDVLYSYDIDPDELDDTGEVTQEELDRFRDASLPALRLRKEQARRQVEEALPEGEEFDEEEDYTWAMFHSYADNPVMARAFNKLPKEYQEQIEAVEEGIVICTDAVEQMQGYTTPARECDDMVSYLMQNLDFTMGQVFDASNLIAQGYKVYSDANAASSGRDTGTPANVGGTPANKGGYAVPAEYAVRQNTNSEGIVTSISYADHNGNTATVPIVDATTKKFRPLKPLEADPNKEYDLAGLSSLISDECAKRGILTGKGLEFFEKELKLFDEGGSALAGLGMTKAEIGSLCTYFKYGNYAFTFLGGLAGCGSTYLSNEQAKADRRNIDIMETNVEELKIREHQVGSNLHKYSLACYNVIQQQRKAAEELKRLLKDKYNIDVHETYYNAGTTVVGCCGTEGTIISFATTNVVNLATWPSKRIADGKLANRIKRYEDLTKLAAQLCEGMESHDASYPVDAILDPAGTVYEAVPSNVLAGVTATVVDAKTGKAWDAESYGQVNPQVTGDDGGFQWDVPSGSWKVRFEKEGYETAETDALQVPPPQLGISFGLVAKAAPTVTSVAAGTDYAEVTFSQYMDCAKGATVTVGGKAVDASALEWVDPEEGADGIQLSRVLRVPVPAGTKVGASVKVSVSKATNYAGKVMAKAATKTVKAQLMPASIEFNFEDTISLQVGVARPTTVRVYDRAGNPIEGATVTASLDNTHLANVDATGAVTDADGAAKVQLEALLPGYTTLTVGVKGTALTREILLLTTTDANQAARPVAQVGGTTVDAGAPAEVALNVSATDTLELSCATEGATIYYTTDGSCPCQKTPGRHEYTGPIVVGEGGTFIIASYKDGMDYSERLKLNLSAGGTVDLAKAKIDGIADQVWFGKALEPELKVTYNGAEVPASGYDVAYANNNQPGTATVTVTGKGVYKGSKKATFTVVLPFTDVTWTANGSGTTAHLTDILWLADTGITTGWGTIPKAEFRPNASVKRGDMAAFLFRLAKQWGVGGASDTWQPSDATKAKFSDVNDKTSHSQAILWLAQNGISGGWEVKKNGKSTYEFRPNANVKRGDLAAFLGRLAKLAGRGTSVKGDPTAFIDVTTTTSHAEEIGWMAAAGISAGWKTAAGAEFRPNAEVKRGDMAAFLQRLDALK